MAVYTEITEAQLTGFLGHFDLPPLQRYSGIAEGIENTNYLLETEDGRYVLTLFEQRTPGEDLPFFRDLMAHLADGNLPCPRPVSGAGATEAPIELAGKPALVVSFLPGAQNTDPSEEQAGAVGEMLARLHQTADDFGRVRGNSMGPAAWREIADKIAADARDVAPDLLDLFTAELDFLERHWPRELPPELPVGIIHGDFFPDNLLWEAGAISGVIDFYFACREALAYDLAVTLNAWCFDPAGNFNEKRAAAIVAGYEAVRPLTAEEKAAMPRFLRGAALRILLSRTHDQLFGVEDALVTPKDPAEYLRILNFHQGN
jgi:homoserine kinase type II